MTGALLAAAALAFLGNSSAGSAKHGAALQVSFRQIMERCGRPYYILRPVSKGKVIITAEPTVRQTPMTSAEVECVRRGVAKLPGWQVVEAGRGK